jgi:hypothetical protein
MWLQVSEGHGDPGQVPFSVDFFKQIWAGLSEEQKRVSAIYIQRTNANLTTLGPRWPYETANDLKNLRATLLTTPMTFLSRARRARRCLHLRLLEFNRLRGNKKKEKVKKSI